VKVPVTNLQSGLSSQCFNSHTDEAVKVTGLPWKGLIKFTLEGVDKVYLGRG